MAADLAKFSLADLEKFIATKHTELNTLNEKRAALMAQVQDIDNQIAALEGSGKSSGRGRPKKFKPAAAAKAKTRKRSVRGENAKPLRTVVSELLASNKKGYSLTDLTQAVLDSGYKTGSANFKNTLYQCLYNNKEFNLDRRSGTYKLNEKAEKTEKAEKAEKV